MPIQFGMNYKLEKFWNKGGDLTSIALVFMNYKLEKFWNSYRLLMFL